MRITTILFVTLLISSSKLLYADDFNCVVGNEVIADVGQGVSLRTCMWEREPGVFIRAGPLELIKNGVLILKANTDKSGKLHGQYTSWSDEGDVIENGIYVQGLKEGDWLKIDKYGKRKILRFRGGNLIEP